VVLLSGHAALRDLGRGAFQEMDQAKLAAPLAKASWVSQGAAEVAADFERALGIAASGRPGPVHLSLPQDVLEGDAPLDVALPPMETAHAALDAGIFIERLRRARRPLILAGPASLKRAFAPRLAELASALGIPAIGMESPRGIADPSLGAFAAILARADCILLLGKRLDFTLRFARPPVVDGDCAFLQVDADAAEIERSRRAVGSRLEATATVDLGAALDALTGGARKHAAMGGGWSDEVRAAIAFRPAAWDAVSSSTAGRLHPVQALRPLQALLDGHPDSIFVSDGGEIGQWAQACLRAPHRVINGVAGAIGAALPFALAARLAQREAPVIAVMGDGTFGFHCAEIDTAVRYGLPFVAVVGNDARWNAEYQIQLREYGSARATATSLLPTRYDQVAAAFGGHGELVTEARELLPAARRALQSGLPACLNVMIEGLPAPDIRAGATS
jgi:acetolactate synthase-1/2/3 large subunit